MNQPRPRSIIGWVTSGCRQFLRGIRNSRMERKSVNVPDKNAESPCTKTLWTILDFEAFSSTYPRKARAGLLRIIFPMNTPGSSRNYKINCSLQNFHRTLNHENTEDFQKQTWFAKLTQAFGVSDRLAFGIDFDNRDGINRRNYSRYEANCSNGVVDVNCKKNRIFLSRFF